MSSSLVVLAAGMGSRYGGLKQMDPVGPSGEFIIDYSVTDALTAGFERIVFVIRRDLEKDFRNLVGRRWENKTDVHYAMQELNDLPNGFDLPADRKKPWGTGHALLAARRHVNETFSVVNADDFYGAEAFMLSGAFLSETARKPDLYGMVAYRLDKTLSDFGSVSRGICTVSDDNMLIDIEERLELIRGPDGIVRDGTDVFADQTLVSMNMFSFKRSFMRRLQEEFPRFLKNAARKPKSEYQMPTALRTFLRNDEVQVKIMQTQSAWFGITSREDRAVVVEHLRNLK